MTKTKSSRAASLLLFLLFAGVAHAVDDSGDWLERMGRAVEDLNYRGVLVHTYAGEADVSQIVHRVTDGVVSERVTAMDEAGREIIRNNGEVTCIFPDQKLIMVEHDGPDAGAGQLPSFMVFDEASYVVAMLGPSRVSGRDTAVLSVTPKDGYRYGYRLWLDKGTAMLLKSQLLDERGMVVEEFLFTAIAFTDSIPAAEVQPSIDIDLFTWERPEPAVNVQVHVNDADWSATDLPAGFTLAAVRSKQAADAKDAMEHLVYSDGLASVSVFVERGVAASEQAEGPSQMGAANAYTTTLEDRLITAVGDVPGRTAKMIALSMRPAPNR